MWQHDDEPAFSLAELIQDRLAAVPSSASGRFDLERLIRLAMAELTGEPDDDDPPGGAPDGN